MHLFLLRHLPCIRKVIQRVSCILISMCRFVRIAVSCSFVHRYLLVCNVFGIFHHCTLYNGHWLWKVVEFNTWRFPELQRQSWRTKLFLPWTNYAFLCLCFNVFVIDVIDWQYSFIKLDSSLWWSGYLSRCLCRTDNSCLSAETSASDGHCSWSTQPRHG